MVSLGEFPEVSSRTLTKGPPYLVIAGVGNAGFRVPEILQTETYAVRVGNVGYRSPSLKRMTLFTGGISIVSINEPCG